MKTTAAILFTLTLLYVSSANAGLVYVIDVNTMSLNGASANLDFQLTPGDISSPAIEAVISDFTTDGTFDPSAIALTGDASGSLATSILLDNGTGYNDAFQPITLGDQVEFTLTLSGPGIDSPASPGTLFGFSIYDSQGLTPLLTTSADGTLAGVTSDASGVNPYTYPATEDGASVATVTLTPEPSAAALFALGIGILAVARFRRSRA